MSRTISKPPLGRLSVCLVLALFCLSAGALQAQIDEEEPSELLSADEPEDLESLNELSLEDLLDMEVTSVSKKKQKLSQSAAAIFVLTQDDIQRAGARSLPEALRLVPGVEVAQLNQHRWAVSIRGFNGAFASKLLVLIDGRSVYTPLFSGVFWNQQDVPIENIERIEVIRGPGGTLWGANAVNGVINVITRSAKETQGGQVRAIAGNFELETFLRYGFSLGDDLYVRLHGRWFDREGFHTTIDDHNDWTSFQGGMRLDWEIDKNDELSLQVNAYDGEAEQEFSITGGPPTPGVAPLIDDVINFAGVNALANWRHQFGDDEEISLQIYYDRTERREEVFQDIRNTYDLDFQHRFSPFESHDFVWGFGYRYISDDFEGSPTITADPDARRYQIFSLFVQDEIELIEDELRLIVGTKIEHNDFSGFEFQPSIRFVWNVDEDNTIWGSVSRAVETPSRQAQDIRIRLGLVDLGMGNFAIGEIYGSQNVVSTDLLAFELGWRCQPTSNLSFDLALFYNDYEHVASTEIGTPFLNQNFELILPFIYDNKLKAETYGVELAADWRVLDELRLTGSYTVLDLEQHGVGTTDASPDVFEELVVHHRIVFRALWNPIDELDLSASVYWNDNLVADDVPSYVRLDFQVRWRPTDDLELGAGVRNLLDDKHPEFNGTLGRERAEIQRSVYFWLDYRF